MAFIGAMLGILTIMALDINEKSFEKEKKEEGWEG